MTERSDAVGSRRGLPQVLRQYHDAQDAHDTDRALATFLPDARVVDEDREHCGADEIRAWLTAAATEYTYTRTLLDVEAVDADTWLVVNHLEGDFPGGVVDLRYRFVLRDDLIAELVIAP
jgi:ketosteroid isomerase-like protein